MNSLFAAHFRMISLFLMNISHFENIVVRGRKVTEDTQLVCHIYSSSAIFNNIPHDISL